MAELKWNLVNQRDEWTVAGLKPSEGTVLSQGTAFHLREGQTLQRMWSVMVEASNASKPPEVELKLDGQRGVVTLKFTEDKVTAAGARVQIFDDRKPPTVELG